jgi:hypothetical protein
MTLTVPVELPVMLAGGDIVSSAGLCRCVEVAERAALAVYSDLRNPPSAVPKGSSISACIVLMKSLIATLLESRRCTKSGPAVVIRLTAFMVNRYWRFSASHHLPDDAMRFVKYAVDGDYAMTRISDVASGHTDGISIEAAPGQFCREMLARPIAPCQRASVGIVDKALTQIRDWRQRLVRCTFNLGHRGRSYALGSSDVTGVSSTGHGAILHQGAR